MTRTVKTNIGKVEVTGVNFIPSDSIVQHVREAFEKFTSADDISEYIGRRFGQYPRNVFVEERRVVFENF